MGCVPIFAGSLESAYSLALGCPGDLRKGSGGDLGTLMISRSI